MKMEIELHRKVGVVEITTIGRLDCVPPGEEWAPALRLLLQVVSCEFPAPLGEDAL